MILTKYHASNTMQKESNNGMQLHGTHDNLDYCVSGVFQNARYGVGWN